MPKPPPKPLTAFFRSFPTFTYNPKYPPEAEFCRLWDHKKWQKPSAGFWLARKRYLEALVEETKSPVHAFFVKKYATFDYDSGASPRWEFERLRTINKWSTTSVPHTKAKLLFEEAFEKDFHSKVDIFFRDYPRFDYNPRESPKREFSCMTRKWRKKSKDYEKARDGFFKAFVEEFNEHLGTGKGEIITWKALCTLVGVDFEPKPLTVSECSMRLEEVHVNICDLLQHMRTKEPFDFFDTEEELSTYSKRERLRFPIGNAKGGPLEFVLRHIDSPIDPGGRQRWPQDNRRPQFKC